MKKIAIVFLLTAIFAIFLFAPLNTVFSFTETRSTQPNQFYISVTEEKNFQIRYTHSIHLTDVLETYEIADTNNLKLVSMEYEDVSIGMPAYAEEGETITYENGKYILTYKDKTLPSFTLYVGDVDAELYFLYDHHSYNLKKLLERGNSYLFEVKKISLFEKWKGAVSNGEKAE